MEFIDLHKQFDLISDKISGNLSKVYEEKHFISGKEVSLLEDELSKFANVKNTVTCGNGTDALTIVLMSKHLNRNDLVFVPSFTFFASSESISLAGATPAFVDVDPDTFNMDPKALEETILESLKSEYSPKGIVAVDLFGLPANFKEIQKIADKYNLFIIEDAAQGFGASIGDQIAGSFGDFSTTSFFPAKPLGCYGDGGAIFTDNDESADDFRSISVHGKGRNKYDNIQIGLNSRLDTIQAVILREKLKIFKKEIDMRQVVARQYTESLSNFLDTPKIPEGYVSTFAQYTLKAEDSKHREAIIKHLASKNIPTAIYYPIPIHQATAYKNIDFFRGRLDVTEDICNRVFSIPMHPYLTEEEITYICNSIKEI